MYKSNTVARYVNRELKLASIPRKFPWSASSQHYISGEEGGFNGKKCESIISQLRALATRTPSLGSCGQGTWL